MCLLQLFRMCRPGNAQGTDYYCDCCSNRYNTLLACPADTGCQKLWLLSPPGIDPLPEWPLRRAWCCGPDSFAQAMLPALSLKNPKHHERPYFVVQNVGETLYIPEQWHHATLALGMCVSVVVVLVCYIHVGGGTHTCWYYCWSYTFVLFRTPIKSEYMCLNDFCTHVISTVDTYYTDHDDRNPGWCTRHVLHLRRRAIKNWASSTASFVVESRLLAQHWPHDTSHGHVGRHSCARHAKQVNAYMYMVVYLLKFFQYQL